MSTLAYGRTRTRMCAKWASWHAVRRCHLAGRRSLWTRKAPLCTSEQQRPNLTWSMPPPAFALPTSVFVPVLLTAADTQTCLLMHLIPQACCDGARAGRAPVG